jgi:chromate transporter
MIYVQIYLAVLKITFLSFGGAYSIWALMEKDIVIECPNTRSAEEVRLCRSEFNSVLAVSEILPGPQINSVAMLAYKNWGIAGMLAFLAALITPGLLIFPVASNLYAKLASARFFQVFFAGAILATLAILIFFILKLYTGLMNQGGFQALLIAAHVAAAFWLSYRYRLSPVIIVLSAGILGYSYL